MAQGYGTDVPISGMMDSNGGMMQNGMMNT